VLQVGASSRTKLLLRSNFRRRNFALGTLTHWTATAAAKALLRDCTQQRNFAAGKLMQLAIFDSNCRQEPAGNVPLTTRVLHGAVLKAVGSAWCGGVPKSRTV
jgi:hypothetical protein